MASDDENQIGIVRAVVRAIDILKAFDGATGPLGIPELTKATGLSRPTLYRLLDTLVSCDMLRSEGEPQRFRIGRFAARLGQVWAAQLEIGTLARPILEPLRDGTGETSALFVLRDGRQYCVVECQSRQALAMSRGIGELNDGFHGASGKAILAWLEPERAHQILKASWKPGMTKVSAEELAAVKNAGYAISHGAVFKGALSIAAPVFDRTGAVIGSLGLFGPEARMNSETLAATVETVVESAKRLSLELGAP